MSAVGVIEGPRGVTDPWSEIYWNKVRYRVRRLQARIVKAVTVGCLTVPYQGLSRVR